MQFPDPSLSETMKPLSEAIVSNSTDRLVLLVATMPASCCICWSSRKTRSTETMKIQTVLVLHKGDTDESDSAVRSVGMTIEVILPITIVL